MILIINNVCTYYNLFILFKIGIILIKIYLNFISVIEIAIIVKNNLDYYRHVDM